MAIANSRPRVEGLLPWRWAWPAEVSVPAVGVTAATVLAVVDLLFGVKLTQLLVVAPCLAAVTARVRAVAGVGVYALAWMTVLAFANGNAGTAQQAVTTVGTVAVTAVSVAVAARRQVLQGAMAAAAQLAAVVKYSDDAIITTDLGGAITSWNHGAERLFGYSAPEMIGVDVLAVGAAQLLRPDRSEPADPAPSPQMLLAKVANGERVEHYRSRQQHPDGTFRELSVSVFPIGNADGMVVGCSAVCRDVTAAVHADAEQAALRAQLHQGQRLESLGQLAGGVAHDFNNLLSVITVTAELIEDETQEPAVRDDIAVIATAAANGSALTRQLLVFARGDGLSTQILDLNTVVGEIGELLARTVGAAVTVDIVGATGEAIFVQADRGRLEQILLNLAVNARDAMPDGGTLTLATRVCQLPDDQPGLLPPPKAGEYVELSVTDTGTGMSPNTAARIFEPFFTTKERGTGTGLGMATVFGAVTDAGGSIAVHSRLGHGTSFGIYIPLAPAAGSAGSAAPGHSRTGQTAGEAPVMATFTR